MTTTTTTTATTAAPTPHDAAPGTSAAPCGQRSEGIRRSEKRPYNPAPIRRCVRLHDQTPGRVAHFVSKSFTRRDETVLHHPTVDLQTGAVHCTCEDFLFRKSRGNPTVFSASDLLCKHILRALDNLQRRAALPQQNGIHGPACIHCADPYAEYEVCDENTGEVLPGQFICTACVDARLPLASDDFQDAAPEAPHEMTAAQREHAIALMNEF